MQARAHEVKEALLADEEVFETVGSWFAGDYDLLLGRRTYDIFAAYWPFVEGEEKPMGDAFTATAGCDKQFATCAARFGNGVNFRGFPHMPGEEAVLRYPNQGDANNGAPLT